MTQSSFYSDNPNYATDYPTQNDSQPQGLGGNTAAKSSFYPNGLDYEEADPARAAQSATDAAASAAAALASQNAAQTSETNAAGSATAAANSATNSATSAAAALASQGAASTSETNAAGSASAAAGSASAASGSATAAAGSATAASGSAGAASTSAGNAAGSATAASGSASAASTSATNAHTSELNAATSATNAAAAVQSAAGTATPLVDGTAAVGTGTKWAREDHRHPSDTTKADKSYVDSQDALKAPLASPTFTGAPAAPTATAGTNTTQLATTAFVATALASAAPVLRNYLAGFTLTWNTTGTVLVTAGQCADSTNTALLSRSTFLVKSTASWAAGTAGGLDTGTIAANTWYHWYVIYNPTTPATDVIFSTSASAPTLPSGYTLSRFIGSVKTNGSSQWTKFVQDGDLFMLDTPVRDIAANNPGTAAVSRTLSTPLGRRVQALCTVVLDATTGTNDNMVACYLSDLSLADVAAGLTGAASIEGYFAGYTFGEIAQGGFAQAMTNTSSQVRSRCQLSPSTGANLYIWTNGWRDTRGKDA